MDTMLFIPLVFALAIAIPVGVMLYSLRMAGERVPLECPVRLRPATVVFGLSTKGRRIDVLRCSIFGRRALSCGKACLPAEG